MSRMCDCETSRAASCPRCITQIVNIDEEARPKGTTRTTRLEKEPQELGAAVEEYRQKAPDDRYTNATTLRNALQRMRPVFTMRPPRHFSTSPEGTCIFA
jgi:hypothetical protein